MTDLFHWFRRGHNWLLPASLVIWLIIMLLMRQSRSFDEIGEHFYRNFMSLVKPWRN